MNNYPNIQLWYQQNQKSDTGLALILMIVAITLGIGLEIKAWKPEWLALYVKSLTGLYTVTLIAIFIIVLVFQGLK